MRRIPRRLIVVGLVVGVVTVVSAQDAPPIARYVPASPDPAHVFVLDSAHLLSPQAVRALQDSSRALQAETSADIAWVTLPTLGGRAIEEAALYIGRTWRIGSAGQPGDPLRNRGLVILFIPDKTKTAGSNFRVEVGNGLEGTITDSRSRAISNAMRVDLRAKRYDTAYLVGWNVAAALVREDFASHAQALGAAASVVPASRPLVERFGNPVQPEHSPWVMVIPILFALAFFVLMVFVVGRSRRRGFRQPMMFMPTPTSDDDTLRRTWSSSSSSDLGGSFDSGASSSSDGGSFGDGGGFSGGGSSDTI
jgi:uncharacterized protein